MMTCSMAGERRHCTKPCRERLRYMWHVLVAFLVVFPLDVLFWRGTWDLLDYYAVVDCASEQDRGNASMAHVHGMQHENYEAACVEFTGNWMTTIFGISVCVLLNCVSPLVQSTADRCRAGTFHATSRLYSYVYAIAYLGQWRGTWNLVDAYSGDYGWRGNLVAFIVCLMLNFLFRLNQFWMSSPWEVHIDNDRDMFFSRPWLGSKPQNGMWQYCIDQLLSQVICVNLNISTWRSLWNTLDDTIYPDNLVASALLTLLSGAVILVLLALSQNTVVAYSASFKKSKWFQRSLLDGCFYVVVNVCVVSMWRGLWNLIAEYFFPDLFVGGLVCHGLGAVCLLAVMSFSTVYENSVDIDGESEDGENLRPQLTPATGWSLLRKKSNQNKSDGIRMQDDQLSPATNKESTVQDLFLESDARQSV
ncbi:hypothetical protein LSH36_1g05012 [Paralvinella palmiformis]|uniref:Transmembrane protein n=1 Tax=Paralvinella palmiformis TaxID=53620 RepID=A0AAD9KFH1_9ANNE|nr:hypothetical protein LSH36_1g05012 [Paralvinella palmiformis]